jgi:outer membrane protein TolC
MKRKIEERTGVLIGVFAAVLGSFVPALSFSATQSKTQHSGATKQLSFSEALQKILDRSTAIATQDSKTEQQFAADLPVRMAFFPTLSLQGTRSTQQDNFASYRTTTTVGSALVNWNLFRFGADIKGWQAANQDESNQTLLRQDQILKVEDLGVQALVTRIQRVKEVEIYSKIVALQEELHHIAKQRYARGLLPAQEVDKVQVDLENARARLADAQIQEGTSKADLVNLLGSEDVRPEWPWIASLKKTESDAEAKQLILGTEGDLSNRPDVKAAESRLKSEEDRYSQRVRQILPTLDASFTYNIYANDVYGLLNSPYNPSWMGQFTLTLPLFDQLNHYSNAKVQSAVRTQADIALEQARRTAMDEWQVAASSFKVSLSSAVAREKIVGLSERVYNDSLTRFRMGRIHANDLAIDQTRLADSKVLSADGWAEAHLTFSRLCHARGLRLDDCFEPATSRNVN